MVDANILLDWLLGRNLSSIKSINNLFKSSKNLVIADVTFVELVFALEKYYKLPRDIVVLNLNKVMDEPVFTINRRVHQLAITDYSCYPSLSYVDCYLMYFSGYLDALPLWTLDKELAKKGNTSVKLLN